MTTDTIQHAAPIIDAGGLFYSIVGTRDLVVALTGAFYALVGILISFLVPDEKLPTVFQGTTIAQPWRRAALGILVTGVFLRIWGDTVFQASAAGFIIYSVGIGFLNYHLTNLLISIITAAVSKITGSQKP